MDHKSCILFSTADWDAPYWTNKQHTAQLLGKRGWRVLYIESMGLRAPRAISSRDWSRILKRLITGVLALLIGPRHVEANVWVLPPLAVPFKHDHKLVRWFNQGCLSWQIKRFLKEKNTPTSLIWSYHPYMLDSIKYINKDRLVYHCVDDLSAVPGVNAKSFRASEIELFKQADVVFTTATSLQEEAKKYNSNSYYFSNVVDEAHFSQVNNRNILPEVLRNISEPRIVYHGALSSYKIDFELMTNVARLHPEWQFVIIGSEPEGQRDHHLMGFGALPNVTLLGYVSYQNLPEYLSYMQVGILPTLINKYTNGMFPMKFYEYIAAALPIVSTHIRALNQVNGSVVEFGDSPQEFAAAIHRQLMRGKLNQAEQSSAIGDNTWEKRLDKMLEVCFRGGNREFS